MCKQIEELENRLPLFSDYEVITIFNKVIKSFDNCMICHRGYFADMLDIIEVELIKRNLNF